VLSKIVSKVLVDERVLGGRGEEVFLLVLTVLRFVVGDVGEDVETEDGSGGDGGTSDDIRGTVRNVEGVFFWVVEDRPGKLGGGGTWDRDNR